MKRVRATGAAALMLVALFSVAGCSIWRGMGLGESMTLAEENRLADQEIEATLAQFPDTITTKVALRIDDFACREWGGWPKSAHRDITITGLTPEQVERQYDILKTWWAKRGYTKILLDDGEWLGVEHEDTGLRLEYRMPLVHKAQRHKASLVANTRCVDR